MRYDDSRRPYVKSPLMAQYFAGHLQTHYKRVVMGYVGIAAGVFLLIGGSLSGLGGGSIPSVPSGATERVWDFLYSIPLVSDVEKSFYCPNPATPHTPTVYYDDPPDIPFPTDPPPAPQAATVESDEDTPFYVCTPGTRWCP